MNELRMILVAALCGVLFTACGDDDVRTPTDAGPRDFGMRDMNIVLMDSGPVDLGAGVDMGPVGMCPSGECDLVANGCPAGQGCYFLASAMGAPPAPVCQPSGIGITDGACMTYTDCAPGFICQGAITGTPGACEKYCCDLGSSANCPAGAMCSVVLTDTAGNPTGAALCRSAANCGIFGTDCAAGQGCYLSGGDGTTDCAMAGTLTTGATCMFTNDCAAGYSCLGPGGGTSTCRKLCDTVDMDPACTGAGETCVSLGIPAPLSNVGACTAP